MTFLAILVDLAAFWFLLTNIRAEKLSVRRDFFLIVLYVESCLYLYVGPTFAIWNSTWAEDSPIIVSLMIASILFFHIPMVLFYTSNAKIKTTSSDDRSSVVFSTVPMAAVIVFSTALAIGFWYVADTYDLWFRRIGHSEIAARLLDLPVYAWGVYRIFDRIGAVLLGFLLMCLLRAPRGSRLRGAMILSVVVLAGVYGRYVIQNSRLDLVLALCLVIGMLNIRLDLFSKIRWRTVGILLIGGLLSAYAVNIINLSRTEYDETAGAFRLEWLNPFYKSALESNDPTVIYERVNCLDLPARTTPEMLKQGPALGAAWLGPLSVALPIRTDAAVDLKANARTTAKVYLAETYSGLVVLDYPSCFLTDLYGNFGPFGFPLAAAACGMMMAWASAGVIAPRGTAGLVIGLLMVTSLLRFEQEFIGLLADIVRFSAPLLVIAILRPVRFLGPTESSPGTPPTYPRAPTQATAGSKPAVELKGIARRRPKVAGGL